MAQLRKKAGVLFLLRFVRFSFAILNLSISAKYFGITLERDLWILALSSIIIFDIAVWGPINETFRAKFLFIKEEEGEVKALFKARSLLLFTSVFSFFIVVLIMVFPQALARLLAPGYKLQQLEMLSSMIMILAPTFLINQTTKLLIAILNAYESFVIPEISGIVTQATTLVLVILLAPSIGIMSLAISYYWGLLLLMVLLLVQIRKLNIDLFRDFFASKLSATLEFIVFSGPFFFSYSAAQMSNIIEKSIASSLETGTISIIDYSRKFSDIPLDVIANTISTLLIPILSLQFARNNKITFLEEFKKIYQLGMLTLTILVALLSSCPESFVNILYNKGIITSETLIKFGNMTMFYSWAMFSVFHYLILGAALISVKKGKYFAFFAILGQVIMTVLNLTLYEKIGLYIFPISLMISHFICAGLMFSKGPFLGSDVKKTVIKYSTIMIGICSTMFFLNHIFVVTLNDFLLIGMNTILIATLLTVSLVVFKMEERVWIRHFLRYLFHR